LNMLRTGPREPTAPVKSLRVLVKPLRAPPSEKAIARIVKRTKTVLFMIFN